MAQEEPEKRLSDLAACEVQLSCSLCTRKAKVHGSLLIDHYGGERTMSEFLLMFAARKGCERAKTLVKSPGHPNVPRCRISYRYERLVQPQTPFLLGDAVVLGWTLTIKCASYHQGLKSVRPCRMKAVTLDMETMLVSLGPNFIISRLEKTLRCPNCGRLGLELFWYLPGGRGDGAVMAAE